jgi:hypothetical protein
VASLDEWHQSFLPSRTGTIHDVVLDTTAGLAAQILLFLWLRDEKSDRPEAPGSLVHKISEEPGRRSSPVTE